MKHYCITGGIGSGKSYVCNIMRQQGIAIYDSDSAAKVLMNTSEDLRRDITALIGPDAYLDGKINKAVVTKFLLDSAENKQALNAVVHPAVMRDYYNSGLQWMECAILYDAHLEAYVDKVVAVVAPEEVRIARIMQRDGITRERAQTWINAQTPQEVVASRADYVIINDGKEDLMAQISRLVV